MTKPRNCLLNKQMPRGAGTGGGGCDHYWRLDAQDDDLRQSSGGEVVGVGALIDRSGGTANLGVPRAALVTLAVRNFDHPDCPLCKSGIPAVKPSSRTEPAPGRNEYGWN